MSNDSKVRYCPYCLGTNIIYDKALKPNGNVEHRNYPVIYKGFVADELRPNECLICGEPLIIMSLTISDWAFLTAHSTDIDFLLAMDKLKNDDIIEYTMKVSKLKEDAKAYYKQKSTPNIPKCPTCGSTDVKKISGGKRWMGTGLFGFASSDLGKTMKCNNCGYKW